MTHTTEAVAYHEAGHVVLHVLTGKPFKTATIVPGDENYGQVNLDYATSGLLGMNLDSKSREIGALARDVVMILFAGGLAEAAFTGCYNAEGSGSDMDNIDRIVSHRSRNPGVYKRSLKSKTKGIIRHPKNWRLIRIVAEALIERQTLSYDEVWALLEKEIN